MSIAILAYNLPMPLSSDFPIVLLSLGVTILASGLALFLVSRQQRDHTAKAEARFCSLVQNASDIIAVVTADGTITYASPSIKRILGYIPEDWVGKKSVEFVHPNDITQAQHLLQEVLRYPATNIVAELRLRTANSQAREFEVIATNLLEDASAAGIVVTYRDISKSKQTQLELSKALQRLTFLVENSPLAVIEWDRDFRVSRWSREAEALFGWQAEEVVGKHPQEWQFIYAEDWDAVAKVVEGLRYGSLERNVSPNRNYTKDGSVVYCEWYNSALLDESGNLVSVLSLILDVTEQKQAEAALLTRATELARLTTMLAQTNAHLEKRNQDLDEFAYIVSHDLKAPLRAIANLSQWIEEDISDRLTPDTKYQMELLRRRVHRMEALIDGLLQYSRVGRITTPTEIVSVATILSEVIDSLAPPGTFKITVQPDMPTLVTERLPLEQVFTNLLSNAIKHHPRLDGKIQISVKDKERFYEFAVNDDGAGIPTQYHEKIFGIFQTLAGRDRVENTGIGLAIVKKIVENHQGTIHLASQPGQGTTFSFTWPKNVNKNRSSNG